MAIIAYTGVMGSGKTYEAVSTAILTALKAGRRVVTNIAGLNFEAIRDYLGQLNDGSLLEPEKILLVASSRITEPYFFFDPDLPNDTVVKPGDLVVIDEVWSFWGTDCKLSLEHQKFFRMHRHYTELGTGTSCDLCLQIQDLMSLHRFVRGVLESTYKFTKMKTLGLSSRYRVEVYEGSRQRKATLVSASLKKYDPRIFPLYKSYEGKNGKEQVVDDRQNLFRNKWFITVFFVSIVGLVGSGYWFVRWIANMQDGGSSGAPTAQVPVKSVDQLRSVAPSQATPFQQASVPASDDYRLVSVLEPINGETVVIFQTADGRFIRRRMDSGVIDGWQTMAGHQGRMVGFSFGSKTK